MKRSKKKNLSSSEFHTSLPAARWGCLCLGCAQLTLVFASGLGRTRLHRTNCSYPTGLMAFLLDMGQLGTPQATGSHGSLCGWSQGIPLLVLLLARSLTCLWWVFTCWLLHVSLCLCTVPLRPPTLLFSCWLLAPVPSLCLGLFLLSLLPPVHSLRLGPELVCPGVHLPGQSD